MKVFRPWKRPVSTIITGESCILVSWRAGSKTASSVMIEQRESTRERIFLERAINFAAKKASGSAAVSPEGDFTVYLEPRDSIVAVRDNGGTERASPAASGGQREFYPVVIPSRYNFADTSGISITAAADSNPVTIAIEKQ